MRLDPHLAPAPADAPNPLTGTPAPVRFALRPTLAPDGTLPEPTAAALRAVATDERPDLDTADWWAWWASADELLRVTALQRTGPRELRYATRLTARDRRGRRAAADPTRSAVGDARATGVAAVAPRGDPRVALVRLALAEADQEGLVWTPTLDVLASTGVWAYALQGLQDGRLPGPSDRLARLAPWIAAQTDGAVFRPLLRAHTDDLRTVIAEHARCLAPADLDPLGLTTPALEAVLLRNETLPPATQEIILLRVARRFGQYVDPEIERTLQSACLAYLERAGAFPAAVREALVGAARAQSHARPAAELLLRDPALPPRLVRLAATTLTAYAASMLQRRDDEATHEEAGTLLAPIVAHPAVPLDLLESLLPDAATAAAIQEARRDARRWTRRPSLAAVLPQAASLPRYTEICWRACHFHAPRPDVLAFILERYGAHNENAPYWVLGAESCTEELARRALLMPAGDKVLQMTVVNQHPFFLRDPVIAEEVLGTRSPEAAECVLRRVPDAVPPSAFRRLWRLAIRYSPENALELLETRGVPPKAGLVPEDFTPLLKLGGPIAERAVLLLARIDVPTARGGRRPAP